jgi:hypothetical protein
MTLVEAARRVSQLLGLRQRKDDGKAGDPGTAETVAEQETAEEPEEREQEDGEEEAETAMEETDTEWSEAAPPPVPPFASQPAAEPPADPQPRRPRRRTRYGTPDPAPSEAADAGATSSPAKERVTRPKSGISICTSALPLPSWGKKEPAAAGGNAKIPDKFPVLRDSGRRSKRAGPPATRTQRVTAGNEPA